MSIIQCRVRVLYIFALATLTWLAIGMNKMHAQSSDKPLYESATTQHSGNLFDTGANEFGVWGGGSFGTPTLIGTTQDTRFGIIGVRYARVLARGDALSFKYTIDAIPAAVLSYPVIGFVQTSPNTFVFKRTRKSMYGAGISPIGFQLNFRRHRRVQPFADVSGGFLYFAAPIPNSLGKQFNFTADFGGGVQFMTHTNRAVTIGYQYHHISNGNHGIINPGFDSNLIYAGFSLFK